MGDERGRVLAQLATAEAIAHLGSWEWTLASGEVTWSDELYRIYGLEPRSVPITLDFFLSRIHPDDRERVQGEVRAAIERPGRFSYRETIVRPDGTLRTLDTVGETVADERGVVVGLVGTCRDVTEHAEQDARLRFFGDVFESVQLGLSAWQLDPTGELRLTVFNPATERVTETPLADRLGATLRAIWPALASTSLTELARRVHDAKPVLRLAPVRLREEPGAPQLAATLFPMPNRSVGLVIEDVTERMVHQLILAGERRALELLAAGAPLSEILDGIVRSIEEAWPGTIASILLLDETGTRIRHGAAPGLPEAYNRAIEGTPIGPQAGSCGTAMYRREPVYANDIETDPLWADYAELARRHGLRACWSFPIVANDGRVLGSFALYQRAPCSPDAHVRSALERSAQVAAIVLERRALDDQLRALAGRIEAAREDERTAIARDIHDQLGQALTALKLDVGWLQRRVSDEALERKLAEMARAADEIIATVRRISTDLRPGILDDIGLAAAIEWQAEEFTKRTGIPCEVHSDVTDLRLERGLATTVFRIFQESLTNVARHASATRVDVTLRLDHGQLRLEIADDGIGLPDVSPRTSTLGILGMGERARRLGGECTVRRRQPRGTIVSLAVPLRFPTEHAGGIAG